MRVVRADVLGMCFGVRDALAVIEAVKSPGDVAIHGQLVHNPLVSLRLQAKGFTVPEGNTRPDLPDQPVVLITAHGVSDAERQRLISAGKTLIDTTCPLVRRAHQAAVKLGDQGYHVVVIGRKAHVEVLGLTGDLTSFDVVESIDQVQRYPHTRIGIICQTTFAERVATLIIDSIVRSNPQAQVRCVDTICAPTKDHQRSLVQLISKVDAMVVVGGNHSNNTRELTSLCREHGIPTCQVETAGDLDLGWLATFETVGLTAGTSALDATIDEVEQALWAVEAFERAMR